jgi:hypothetical protein
VKRVGPGCLNFSNTQLTLGTIFIYSVHYRSSYHSPKLAIFRCPTLGLGNRARYTNIAAASPTASIGACAMMAAPAIEEEVFEAAMATPGSSRTTSAQSDILAPAPVALLPELSIVALYPLPRRLCVAIVACPPPYTKLNRQAQSHRVLRR